MGSAPLSSTAAVVLGWCQGSTDLPLPPAAQFADLKLKFHIGSTRVVLGWCQGSTDLPLLPPAQFADLKLKFSIGGQISFDVFPIGWDKVTSAPRVLLARALLGRC